MLFNANWELGTQNEHHVILRNLHSNNDYIIAVNNDSVLQGFLEIAMYFVIE